MRLTIVTIMGVSADRLLFFKRLKYRESIAGRGKKTLSIFGMIH